jgi:hypothetical protein
MLTGVVQAHSVRMALLGVVAGLGVPRSGRDGGVVQAHSVRMALLGVVGRAGVTDADGCGSGPFGAHGSPRRSSGLGVSGSGPSGVVHTVSARMVLLPTILPVRGRQYEHRTRVHWVN